jgi:hypothetical protein
VREEPLEERDGLAKLLSRNGSIDASIVRVTRSDGLWVHSGLQTDHQPLLIPNLQSVPIHHAARRLDGLVVIESLDKLGWSDNVIVGSEKVRPVYEPPFSFGHLRRSYSAAILACTKLRVLALVLVKSPAAGTQATGAGG